MKIALDVDGVLADVIVSWINYSNSIRSHISNHELFRISNLSEAIEIIKSN